MTHFYNITGLLICVVAFLTYRLGGAVDEPRREFRLAIRLLSLAYLFSGLSLFAAQMEPQLAQGDFDILNPLMLLFFYIISHTFVYIVLLLYQATDVVLRRFRCLAWPVLVLFGIYTVLYIIVGDVFVYSLNQALERLVSSPMFIFRIGLFITILGSLLYNVYVCYEICRIYTKRVTESLSEIDFQRSIVLSKFMWNLKALSIWVLLTYFYTTPILEIISCSLMWVVFALQYVGFRGYIMRRNTLIFNALTASGEVDFEIDTADAQLRRRIGAWAAHLDKPFTRSSLTITDVAREVGVSKNRLSKYINSTDTNFRSWLNELRIEEAQRLLVVQREMPLSEVAEMVGFCDLPAFSHAFKKVVGVSPRAFRNDIASGDSDTVDA